MKLIEGPSNTRIRKKTNPIRFILNILTLGIFFKPHVYKTKEVAFGKLCYCPDCGYSWKIK